jgi:hypothetical protein
MATVLEQKRPADRTPDDEKRSGKRSNTVQTQTYAKTIVAPRTHLEEYKVIFLIDDEGVSPKAFDLAIDTARTFSAKLVLTYLVENEEIPEGYREYARAEGIGDYESGYFDLVANNKLASLGERAQAEGIDWTTSLYFGNAKKATKFYVGDKRAIIVVNRPAEKSVFARLADMLRPHKEH